MQDKNSLGKGKCFENLTSICSLPENSKFRRKVNETVTSFREVLCQLDNIKIIDVRGRLLYAIFSQTKKTIDRDYSGYPEIIQSHLKSCISACYKNYLRKYINDKRRQKERLSKKLLEKNIENNTTRNN